MGRLDGKVAIVTGGVSGIGRETVKVLCAEGARVMIADVAEPAGRELAAELGQGACFQSLDVRSEAQWKAAVASCVARWGRLDVLVNNAGINGSSQHQWPDSIDLEEWRKVQAVNVEGVLLGCKYAIPAMRDTGSGSIVNLSSMAGIVGTPNLTGYGASKAAVYQISKTVALHCARRKYPVRCNSVHPGMIKTQQLSVFTPEELEVRRAAIPLGDFGTPRDVALAILFLASDESRYITGSRIVVDGGVTMQ
jgi:3(or 17)beta-hydroxysteroid dehydrogenase